MESVTPFDLFPQTGHVESISVFGKGMMVDWKNI